MSIILPEDLDNLRHSARILASCLWHIQKKVQPGVSAGKLDAFAEEFIRDHQAEPSFKGLYGFPYTLISEVNDEVVHGISPESKIIPDNCVVSFDCGVKYKGMYSDMCILLILGDPGEKAKFLVQKTTEALWAGIRQVKAGKRLGDVTFAIERVIKEAKLGNVTDLGGHGIGYKAHTSPHIVHAGQPGKGPRLFENQCICLEPMVTLGSGKVVFEKIPGSQVEIVRSADKTLAAHIEHQILVTKDGCEVLTDLKEEDLLK